MKLKSIFLSALTLLCASILTAQEQTKPNVVLIVMDNLGWGEVGAYGGGILRGSPTPEIDELATEGLKLLNFNVEPQCTPSRSALMSGRHPIRSGTTKVVWGLPYGLVGWEVTMAELFSDAGYATGMYGKWHLGDMPGRWPTDQGFDHWYGIPNTTDESMYSSQPHFDPTVVEAPQIVEARKGQTPKSIKEYNLETRRTIDRELTQKAMAFMENSVNSDKPFFAYIPLTQCHLPVLPHPDFEGSTGNGAYADMLAEMDYNVGQIKKKVEDLGVEDNTIFIWMSENGPEEAPSYFGTAGYWRGHYFTTLEGSLRTSFIVRWPNKIPANSVSNEIVHITDLLPTFSSVAGYNVPTDRKIDGVDQMELFLGNTEKSSREGFPAYNGPNMQSYKWRNFKIHYWDQQSMFGAPAKLNFPKVHDLLKDPKELYGLYGGTSSAANGTEQLTWVLPAITYEVLKFQKSLQEEPPVPFPAPEPYSPKNR